MTDEPTGWVKPVANPTRESLRVRIAELRAEPGEAPAQFRALENDARLEALVRIRTLMCGLDLTPAALEPPPAVKRRGRPREVRS